MNKKNYFLLVLFSLLILSLSAYSVEVIYVHIDNTASDNQSKLLIQCDVSGTVTVEDLNEDYSQDNVSCNQQNGITFGPQNGFTKLGIHEVNVCSNDCATGFLAKTYFNVKNKSNYNADSSIPEMNPLLVFMIVAGVLFLVKRRH